MGAAITYPDGTELLSSALTIQQIGAILQPLTLGMIGKKDNAQSSPVRLEWPSAGQPFQEITDDICYLRAVPRDEPYNRIRDRFNWPGGIGWGGEGFGAPPWGGTSDPDLLTEGWTYTRAWAIRWCFYGPNSTDLARALRSALYQDYFTNALSQVQLFPVSDFPEPVRAPELLDGQWFERCDFEAEFYEFVTEAINRGTVKSVEVFVENAQGVIADLKVEAPTTANDNFERPNESPLDPSNWTKSAWPTDYPLAVLNEECVPSLASIGFLPARGYAEELYTGIDVTADQYAGVVVGALEYAGLDNIGEIAIFVRSNSFMYWGTAYVLFIIPPAAAPADPLQLFRIVDGVYKVIATAVVSAINPGDSIVLSVKGMILTVKVNGDIVATVADSAIANGKTGLALSAATSQDQVIVTDFSCGSN